MQSDYVRAARYEMGTPASHIILRHPAANALGPIIVAATLGVPAAILVEAGIGLPWDSASTRRRRVGDHAVGGCRRDVVVPTPGPRPLAALVCTMLAFTYLGDGLRDALDPTGGLE